MIHNNNDDNDNDSNNDNDNNKIMMTMMVMMVTWVIINSDRISRISNKIYWINVAEEEDGVWGQVSLDSERGVRYLQ